ncbi:Ceramidase protein [Raphanus sativus]|nr:Ceramidase protein [Raphanus sativus]
MADGISSFWGPVTSTIECCEKNYAYSSYIAEFYNTISNVPGILLALIGLVTLKATVREEVQHPPHFQHDPRYRQHALPCHFAARRRQQQSDETPMVWEILLYMYILYSPDWHYRSTMPTFLFLYGAAFAAVHAFLRFGSVSRSTTWSFAFSASLGCTSTTFTPRIPRLKGLPSGMSPRFLWGVFAGSVTVFSARGYLSGL